MAWIVRNLWLIPVLPALAAGLIAFAKQRMRSFAAGLAIGSMFLSLLLACGAFLHTLSHPAAEYVNFSWLQFGAQTLQLGWLLNPLSAVMLVMVTLAALLIFIYSAGYMGHDENFTRFFCFLALFAGAMLGVVIANSLLLLFMCWEVVGLTSYLLIGFWYERPAAAAAAKKAFIVTRIGDMGLFLGMMWLYGESGTLLFYNHGAGCLEGAALSAMAAHATVWGLSVSSGIGLLIFCGAAGKSGQVPLHVWLPDAMEGPTPVSALIHAATMVAAGVFLIARVYPLMAASSSGGGPTAALEVVTWIGAITAIFAAFIAVAQNDIKRILAYSTVSQLGYMMMGLGVGGVAVGMFHLITHAFFKALLFLGAGSVIHGCGGEQDIRNMGGLRKLMPVTFITYAAGMLALCGVPFFAGFWSKDEILHSAHLWSVSAVPFYLGAIGALLTAFYMTRQVYYVFFGEQREALAADPSDRHAFEERGSSHELEEHGIAPASGHIPAHTPAHTLVGHVHESPLLMTAPLMILAVFAALLGFIGTPAWPWFQGFLENERVRFGFGQMLGNGTVPLMVSSSLIVFAGLGLGWWFYGRRPITGSTEPDPLERLQPGIFHALADRLYVDKLYGASVIPLTRVAAHICDWMDRNVFNGAVQLVSLVVVSVAHFDSYIDRYLVNPGFDRGCRGMLQGGDLVSRLQNGRVQNYLRVIGIALAAFGIFLIWGARG